MQQFSSGQSDEEILLSTAGASVDSWLSLHGCLAMQLPTPCFPHLQAVPEVKTSPARECTGPREATSFDEDLSNLFDLTSLTKEPFKEDELFHVAAISHVNQEDFFSYSNNSLSFPHKIIHFNTAILLSTVNTLG